MYFMDSGFHQGFLMHSEFFWKAPHMILKSTWASFPLILNQLDQRFSTRVGDTVLSILYKSREHQSPLSSALGPPEPYDIDWGHQDYTSKAWEEM